MSLSKVFKGINSKLPEYLLQKYQLSMQVIFSVFFAIVFLNIYIPFSEYAWFELGATLKFYFTVGFFTIAIGILVVSRILMYKAKSILDITFLVYILWCIVEIIIIASLYTWITIDLKLTAGLPNIIIFARGLLYTTISLGVPYIVSGMYFSIQDKNNTIRLLKYENVVTDESIHPDEQKIALFDNSGVLKLSASSSNLYYIESDDNYIKVWYEDSKGVLQQYMLRCRLKTVEESFKGSSLVRCHRKYIINLQKVSILRKESDGYFLELDSELISPLPVSKTYTQSVIQAISSQKPLMEHLDF